MDIPHESKTRFANYGRGDATAVGLERVAIANEHLQKSLEIRRTLYRQHPRNAGAT